MTVIPPRPAGARASRRAGIALATLFTLVSAGACGDASGPRDLTDHAAFVSLVPNQFPSDTIGTSGVVEVEVDDSASKPIAGAQVQWATSGGSFVSNATSITDRSGVARSGWTLGNALGTTTLTITVGRVTPLAQSITIRPGAPATASIAPTELTLGLLNRPLSVYVQFADRVGHSLKVFDVPLIHWGTTDATVAVADFVDLNTGEAIVLPAGAGHATVSVTGSASGLSGSASASVSVEVMSLPGLVSVNGHACALSPAGQLYCWIPTQQPQLTATPEPLGALTMGIQHTCALSTTGRAYCWGNNYGGEVGIPNVTQVAAPTAVATDLTFRSIGAGRYYTCAVSPSDAAYCWGSSPYGELGNDTLTGCPQSTTGCSSTPVAVSGGLRFASLDLSSGNHVCGVTIDADAYCWGSNTVKQFGNPSAPLTSTPPIIVGGGLKWRAIAVGPSATCGLDATGLAYCWGGLGWGNQVFSGYPDTPLAVPGGMSFRSLDMDDASACAVDDSGGVFCWPLVQPLATPTVLRTNYRYKAIVVDIGLVCGTTTTNAAACNPIAP